MFFTIYPWQNLVKKEILLMFGFVTLNELLRVF